MSHLTYPPSTAIGPYTVNLSPTSTSTFSIGSAHTNYGSIYTTSGSNGISNPVSISQRALIELKGEDADIMINGKSLKEAIENIEQRLNLLTINVELEKEWAELRELGERYRALEKEIKVKMKTWDILKTQD